MKKKVVNIALDLETLSRRSTAAIIGIAAKAFSLGESKVTGEKTEFFRAVDGTSCAMHGFDIVEKAPTTKASVAARIDYMKSRFFCDNA